MILLNWMNSWQRQTRLITYSTRTSRSSVLASSARTQCVPFILNNSPNSSVSARQRCSHAHKYRVPPAETQTLFLSKPIKTPGPFQWLPALEGFMLVVFCLQMQTCSPTSRLLGATLGRACIALRYASQFCSITQKQFMPQPQVY